MKDSQPAYDRILRPVEDRMIQSIWRIVRRADDAEDALQDALLIIWKRWHRVLRHPCPEALVLKICVDAAYDLTRRRLRERGWASSETAEPAAASVSPVDAVLGNELHLEIMTAMHRLPRKQAIAVLMRLVQGQSYPQIAAALGCGEATARTHVARGRSRLQILLSHLNPTNAQGSFR